MPSGWESRRDWPVLWLLHGGLDDYASWTAKPDVDALTRTSGLMVVMPDGGKCGSYSDWWNGGDGVPPRWATYHLKELLPLLESRYRAGRQRAVAGYSMGGQGAMLYAAKGTSRPRPPSAEPYTSSNPACRRPSWRVPRSAGCSRTDALLSRRAQPRILAAGAAPGLPHAQPAIGAQ
ncbi:alpha/beta hydrolase-fold protein [Nonomuraea sp. NPDC050680]|uniref:alpha/beta hydrolase n=1 Tax=Nonomuraea sp. NPDC050680 TaxID=3154630 RepID=UPI00340C74D4